MKRKTKKRSGSGFNLTRIAAVISGELKIPCSKQAIKNWQRKNPPFPSPAANGHYRRAECLAWVKKYITPSAGPVQQTELKLLEKSMMAKAEREIDRAKRERFALNKDIGMFIDRDEARVKAITAIRKYHAFVVEELENNLPFECAAILKDIGATGELVSAFLQWVTTRYQAAIDRIEQRCEDESKEVDTIEI